MGCICFSKTLIKLKKKQTLILFLSQTYSLAKQASYPVTHTGTGHLRHPPQPYQATFTYPRGSRKRIHICIKLPGLQTFACATTMARLSNVSVETPDTTAINLTVLLARLHDNLVTPDSRTDNNLRTSQRERDRVGKVWNRP